MKIKLISTSALTAIGLLTAGCSFVGLEDMSPNWKETRAISESYQVINPKALGQGYIHQISLGIVPLYRWGGNFESGYQDILSKNPGSDDVINVRSDMSGMNFLFYQRYEINIRGAAIKYTSDGKGNPAKAPTIKD